jgi:putative transposase
VRAWCEKFGREYAKRLRKSRGAIGDTWHLDEVYLRIDGCNQYLWRAVDQHGEVIDILVQSQRNTRAAERFFRKLLKVQGTLPRRLVTDQLGSYGSAARKPTPGVAHIRRKGANNRAENSHQPTRERERRRRRFRSPGEAQRFLSTFSTISNQFRQPRHQMQACHHRVLMARRFAEWREVCSSFA